MPDIAQHHAFGQDVYRSLPEEIQSWILPDPYGFALYGPDIWFTFQPWKRRSGRGRRMHTTKTGAFLTALARRTREGSAPRETFSYLAGFLCHYALDSNAHPYIVWQTTEIWPTPRAHRDLEHALDAALLKREGSWGERHPVTDHHMPPLRLPETLSEDLDAVYGEIYGWEKVLPALNRCYRWYRTLFRHMELPHSFWTGLSRLIPTSRFRSIPYVRSAFLERDVENLSHQLWRFPCDREITFRESYPELYEKARKEAVRLIEGCYAYAREDQPSLEQLSALLGNKSYLSGISWDDPRNLSLPGLRPPKGAEALF